MLAMYVEISDRSTRRVQCALQRHRGGAPTSIRVILSKGESEPFTTILRATVVPLTATIIPTPPSSPSPPLSSCVFTETACRIDESRSSSRRETSASAHRQAGGQGNDARV